MPRSDLISDILKLVARDNLFAAIIDVDAT